MCEKIKPQLVIIEGPQGVGKTAITNLLREHSVYTNLIKLSGIKVGSECEKDKIFDIHLNTFNYIENVANDDINYILERSFVSEKVYCNLGFKDYDFKLATYTLSNKLESLTELYDVHFILLTASPNTFAKRLKRDKPKYSSVEYLVENSLRQQSEYLKEFVKLKKKCDNIKCHLINTTDKEPFKILTKIKYALLRWGDYE